MQYRTSSLDPCYVLFLNLSKHAPIKSQLDMQTRIVYNQRNPLFVVPKRFDQLYSHPMVPFLEHLLDKHVRIAYNQCKYCKF
jgi:hypothetical protein